MAIDINIPSQVRTFANLAAFPATGALKTIYIAEDTNKTYRWTGSVYVEVSAAGATGITIGTTAITSGTVGRVLFQGTGNVVQQSADITWDNTNVLFALGSIATRILNFRPQDTTGAYGNSCSIRGGNGNGRLDFYSGSNITELRDNIIILTSVGGPSVQVGASSISLSVGGSTRLQVAPTTGNVLINTTTDAGFRLDVNGTARVQDSVTVSRNQNATTGITLANTTAGAAAASQITIQSTTSAFVGKFSSSTTAFRIITQSDLYLLNQTAGDIAIHNDFATGKIKWATGGVSTPQMTLFSTGNFAINTTTDAGFKLDVNGTARVSGQISSGITGTNGSIGLRRTSDGSIVGSFYTDAAQTIVKEHTGTGGVLLNGFDTTSLKWVGSSSQPRVGIGFNGTINATCHIKGAFATSATSSLLIENSAGTAAMRVRDDLVILLPNLPTTSAGLPTGAIYNDAGTLKIV